MRGVVVVVILVTGVAVSLLGFRGTVSERRPLMLLPDMDFQPRYHPQGEGPFFADGRSMRTPPAGTVAYAGGDYESDAGSPRRNPDLLQADDRYYRGKQGADWVAKVPLKLDMELLRRGRERFEIYCQPCHGATGAGNGLMTQYGMIGVASITDELHALMPDGQFFDVISNGKGRMLGYGSQLKVRDRWAVVAYIRALSRSQRASLSDVPEERRGELER